MLLEYSPNKYFLFPKYFFSQCVDIQSRKIHSDQQEPLELSEFFSYREKSKRKISQNLFVGDIEITLL